LGRGRGKDGGVGGSGGIRGRGSFKDGRREGARATYSQQKVKEYEWEGRKVR